MNRTRFITFVALAFVLYIATSAGAASVRFDLGQLLALLSAFALSVLPLLLSRRESSRALSQVSLLSLALSLSLSSWVARSLFALAGELFLSMLLPVAGVVLIELAVSAPDVPPRLMRQARSLFVVRVLGVSAAVLGVVAALPPVWVLGRALIAPSWVSIAPFVFAMSALVLSMGIRLLRRRFGSDARSLAQNLWSTVGTWLAAALLALTVAVARRQVAPGIVDVLVGLSALSMVAGHVLLLSQERALSVGPVVRRLLASGLTVCAGAVFFLSFEAQIPDDTLLRVLEIVALMLALELLRTVITGWVQRFFSPVRGVLLDAIAQAQADMLASTSLDDLAARVLGPLRRAALLPEAAPLLFTSYPPREFRLDAAGNPQVSQRGLPLSIAAQLERAGLLPILRTDLQGLLVRRPELRDVLAALDQAGALLALPLVLDGELEGVLLLARGARKSALTIEELSRLEQLGRGLAALISVFAARERAHTRSQEAAQQVSILGARLDEQAYDLMRLGSQAEALRSEPRAFEASYQVAAYSPAMRGLLSRLEQVAPHDVPVCLIGEVGEPVVALARLVHAQSGRASRPFIALDAAELTADTAQRKLFGDHSVTPPVAGAFELTEQGTLFIADVVALPLEVQRALALSMAERRGRPLGSESGFVTSVRLVLSVRSTMEDLTASGKLAPELARWLEPTCYRVPPLRERLEDLESLIMLAVDRAARVSGRLVPGLTPEALRALAEYTWPANLEELESVMARAVLACRGPRLTLSDLPPLPVAGAQHLGSFVDQEREILRRALERAGGNKTRAARALGLKRTTLVDKLKRLGLDESGPDTTH